MITAPLTIQPIPYQGSKRALAPQIARMFPDRVATLYEPFAGSAAMSLFAATHNLADDFVIGDICEPLVALWALIIDHPTELSDRYRETWHRQFDVGPNHFYDVRSEYNESHDPVLLLYLIVRCVKNAVRFGRHGNFNQSPDKRRTGMKPDRVTRTAHAVSRLLKGRVQLFQGDFQECCASASGGDLIYLDPPYQGTTYGTDKRYIAGLGRERLIDALLAFNARNVPYILSYDGRTGNKTYGQPLPDKIVAHHLALHGGRSSQATICGRKDETIESLYVSQALNAGYENNYHPSVAQEYLFT